MIVVVYALLNTTADHATLENLASQQDKAAPQWALSGLQECLGGGMIDMAYKDGVACQYI